MILKDKVAIVTGGGSGIGRAIALRFAREGASIVVVGRTFKKVEETAADIESLGANSLALRTDVSVSDEVRQMVKASVERFGVIDILVNNAAIMSRKTFFDYTEEDWDRVLAVNLKGVFLCCKEVVPVMLKQTRSGKIINIASSAGLVGLRRGAYGPSKAGVINFTASLALELAPYKINVNSISPGPIVTDMLAALRASPELEKKILNTVPYGRLGHPEDIAGVALFLASEDSNFMVGTNIIVDGGRNTTRGEY